MITGSIVWNEMLFSMFSSADSGYRKLFQCPENYFRVQKTISGSRKLFEGTGKYSGRGNFLRIRCRESRGGERTGLSVGVSKR